MGSQNLDPRRCTGERNRDKTTAIGSDKKGLLADCKKPLFDSHREKLFEPSFGCLPMDVLEERLDVIGPFQPVIDHERVLKDIQDQDGVAAGKVSSVVFVDPAVEEIAGGNVLI